MTARAARHQVIEDHLPEVSTPLRVKAGDLLVFERRETEWEGWLWCTDSRGVQGWVPENWVSIAGKTCRAERDYTSKELRVRAGEILTIHETESGWGWGTNLSKEAGWVPLRCLADGPEPG